MTDNISEKDKKDWENFLSKNEKLPNKDFKKDIKLSFKTRSIDLHGYTLEEANKSIENFIIKSYILNTLQNTITFSSQDMSLLEGTFNVIVFNETTFTLNQQVEETLGDLTVKANVNLSLERK